MSEINISRGIGSFKENAKKFFEFRYIIESRPKNQNILGKDLCEKFIAFHTNFYQLQEACNIIKWTGNSGETLPYSAFFFNYFNSGYQHCKKSHPECENIILNLSDNIVDLLEVMSFFIQLEDFSKKTSEEVESKRNSEIKEKTKTALEKAEVNLRAIARILWPDVILFDKSNYLVNSPVRDSALLETIKLLDTKDLSVKELSNNSNILKDLLEIKEKEGKEKDKTIKEADKKITDLENSISKDISTDFSDEYEKIRDDLKDEISYFPKLRRLINDSTTSKKRRLCLTPFIALCDLFHLRIKILLLRLTTYLVLFLLLTFPFCEFFGQRIAAPSFTKKLCSCFSNESKNDTIATASANEIRASLNSQKILVSTSNPSNSHNKNGDKNNSYLYLHLALIAIFAAAFQQLRISIKELNIKKNLYEIYRHRVLVSKNYHEMYAIVDGEAKSEVIKSAARSLFENEPSIYDSKSRALPPHALGDIKINQN